MCQAEVGSRDNEEASVTGAVWDRRCDEVKPLVQPAENVAGAVPTPRDKA